MAEDLSKMFQFKLKRGGHQDSRGTYNGGDGKIIYSETNLAKRFGPERFELIREPIPELKPVPQPKEEVDNLDSMTVKELKKLAEENEIDISTVPSGDKEALIRTIREQLGS